jgi:hypothetical protein
MSGESAGTDTEASLFLAVSGGLPIAVTQAWAGKRGDLSFLDAWSTDDDSAPGSLSRTLGLRRLWELVAGIVTKDASWSCPSPMLWIDDGQCESTAGGAGVRK